MSVKVKVNPSLQHYVHSGQSVCERKRERDREKERKSERDSLLRVKRLCLYTDQSDWCNKTLTL